MTIGLNSKDYACKGMRYWIWCYPIRSLIVIIFNNITPFLLMDINDVIIVVIITSIMRRATVVIAAKKK